MDAEKIEIIAECPIVETQTQHCPPHQAQRIPAEIRVETELQTNQNEIKTTPSNISSEETSREDLKTCSTEFFHFVRLMQLFPTVHPATLHTVMTLCKNDFFLAVDRLLYAKRCKEVYETRRRVRHCVSKGNRCVHYSCNEGCAQKGCGKPQIVKLESTPRRNTRRTRNEKAINAAQLQMQIQRQQIREAPITLQCNVPLRPLSPIMQEDMNLENHNLGSVAEVEVVVPQL